MEKGGGTTPPSPSDCVPAWLDASNCGSERNAQPEFDPAAALYAVRGNELLADHAEVRWIIDVTCGLKKLG